MTVKVLDASFEKKYEEFVLSNPESLLYVSNKYRKLLKDFLNKEDVYFLAVDDSGTIKGALPAFISRNSDSGNVLNSIPFYGSNGGVIEFENNKQVRDLLIKSFYDYALNNKCVTTTLVSSPLQPMTDYYEAASQYSFKDARIGQLSALPSKTDNVGNAIMKMIDSKTRNIVRKAQKLAIEIDEADNDTFLEFLITTHQANMAAVKGIAKPDRFFRSISKHFNYGSDYKIFVARLNGEFVAALLVFYFNTTVEYYTPVIMPEFRHTQALSLIIFEAMKDAARQRYRWWNWGGTWTSQSGVKQFKEQWGTQSKNYYYYTRVFDDRVLNKTKSELLHNYPYFFVVPFDKIKSEQIHN